MIIYPKRPEELLGNPPQVQTESLPNGYHGNIRTVEVMKKVARERSGHPLVRTLAINILNYYGTDSHNFVDEAKAIGDYVKQNVKYVRDADGIEQLTDPLTMIDQLQKKAARGDCDDISLLIATLLLAIGHRPYFACVRYYDHTGNFNHIYVIDYDKNYGDNNTKRIVLDGIIKDKPIGAELDHLSGEEFEI